MMIDFYVNFTNEEILNEKQFEELKEKYIPLFEKDMDDLCEWIENSGYTSADILFFSESQKTVLIEKWKETCKGYADDCLCDEGWQKRSLEI